MTTRQFPFHLYVLCLNLISLPVDEAALVAVDEAAALHHQPHPIALAVQQEGVDSALEQQLVECERRAREREAFINDLRAQILALLRDSPVRNDRLKTVADQLSYHCDLLKHFTPGVNPRHRVTNSASFDVSLLFSSSEAEEDEKEGPDCSAARTC